MRPDHKIGFPELKRRLQLRQKLELKYYRDALRQKWGRIPLTFRLVGALVALLTIGLSITGITVVGILQSHLLAQVDRELVITTAKLVDNYDTQTILNLQQNPELLPARTGSYYVRYHIGNSIVSLPTPITSDYGKPSDKDLSRLEKITATRFVAPVTVGSESINGSPWRALSLVVPESGNENPAIITVATPLAPINDTITNVLYYVLVSSVVFILFGAIAAYYLVRLSLLPLKRIEAVADRITQGSLHERINIDEGDKTEVGTLARSLNTMLTHIESAFASQKRSEEKIRRFVSDASHELRTPLAAIKGYGELYRIGGVPEERTGEVMERIESEASRMGRLVEDLLKLARLDEGQRMKFAPVDLATLAHNAALDLTALSPGRAVQCLWINDSGEVVELTDQTLIVEADGNQITQIMTNLVSNANRYTSTDTPVEVCIGKSRTGDKDVALIEVRDHGAGIPKDECTRIFERFYRTDSSRSRETGGTGLGLPIVQAIALAHEGSAEAKETPGGGLTVQIVLPLKQGPHAFPTDELVSLSPNE